MLSAEDPCTPSTPRKCASVTLKESRKDHNHYHELVNDLLPFKWYAITVHCLKL